MTKAERQQMRNELISWPIPKLLDDLDAQDAEIESLNEELADLRKLHDLATEAYAGLAAEHTRLTEAYAAKDKALEAVIDEMAHGQRKLIEEREALRERALGAEAELDRYRVALEGEGH